ncbi:unnamed protein product [Lathyrus sativus]|nr:unnamed protein product [Lathyrus sativus]
MEEFFWQKESRVKWNILGHRNMTYFYRTSNIENSSKLITFIGHENSLIINPLEIDNILVNHFTSIFRFCNNVTSNDLIDQTIPSLISNATNNLLIMTSSASEITNAILSLNKDDSSRPDDFSAFFFQTYWDTIKDGVIGVILQFFISN